MSEIKGVVAAGHKATAEAGKQILESGGNAVDAAIASAFAGCVAEPLLTGLGAGGYMLVHDAKSGKQELFDFGIVMPGKNLAGRKTSEMTPVPVDFGGGTIQMFHCGHASVGVPGFVAGITAAHEKYGSMPLKDLIKPAKKIAKQGVAITKQQEYLIKILAGVYAVTEESKELFHKHGKLLQEGDLYRSPYIVATLDEIADTSGDSFYSGSLAKKLVAEMKKGGGYITAEDLTDYKAIARRPVAINYRGATIATNPPPSSGGALLAHSFSLLAGFDLKKMGWHSAEHIFHLLGAMMVTNAIRKELFDPSAHEEDILERLLADKLIQEGAALIKSPLGNTTHLSVMDSKNNAVSMTTSNGSGSGVAVPGTGILLNNILGEEDLNPGGFHKHPVGYRMTSMMSPTIISKDEKPILSIGSAGSSRIRSAVLQVISNILDFDMDVESAINAPRIHNEGQGTVVELEKGIPQDIAEKVAKDGHQVNLWKEQNLFFGGVQAVAKNPKTGELSGAGDPRRGGVAVTAY
jgi:gamma-glutamyltranspeptidase/glutathione hydrolase